MKSSFIRRAWALLLSLALSLSLLTVPGWAADADSGVTGIEFVQNKVQIKDGNDKKLELLVHGTTSYTVSWYSDNDAIATVQDGTVKPQGDGDTLIWAVVSDGSKSFRASCTVSVSLPVTNLSFEETNIELTEKETAKLEVTVEPSGATQAAITWTSSDPKVATVSGSGLAATVTAVSEGTTTITAKSGNASATCDITVNAPTVESVVISPSSASIEEGKSQTLYATVMFSNGTNTREVTWESSDESIAEVDASGKVTAKAGQANKTVTITATAKADENQSATCEIRISPAPVLVTGITLSPKAATLKMDENPTIKLEAKVVPDDASNTSLTWTTSAQGVARVSADGTVTAVAEGTATITATAKDGSGRTDTCVITVQPADPGITIEQPTLNLALNDSLALGATVTGNLQSKSVKWESSDPSVVQLSTSITSQNAKVTLRALQAGTAVITATALGDETLTDKCIVTVTADPPYEVIISPGVGMGQYLSPGATSQFTAQVNPREADQTVRWSILSSSSDDSSQVATVNELTGMVTAVGAGQVEISAKTLDGTITANESYFLEVSGITLPDKLDITAGRSKQLVEELGRYGAARSGTVVWKSSNDSIATVNTGGSLMGLVPGTAVITVTITSSGNSYSKTCEVTVKEDMANAIEVDIKAGERLEFSEILSDLNSRCKEKDDDNVPLSYVTNLSVPTNQGILYYGYVTSDTPNHGVGGTERYYYRAALETQNSLSDVTFVPAGSFSGTATISYTGYDTNNTPFNGRILVDVESTGDVTYSTAENHPVDFAGTDFSNICRLKTDGRALSYVTFELPASTKGTLYYNYSATGQYSQKVDSTTQYRLSGNNCLDNISFLPAENYTGTVKITYRCTDTSGSSYTGTVTINVYTPAGSASGGVSYTTGVGEKVTLNVNDFNDVSRSKNNSSLNYIVFDSLPSTAEGTLYYNYTSGSRYDSTVSLGIRYYRSSTPRIGYITFVPSAGFSGTVSIPYTGYDSSGGKYSDTLVIHVTGASGTVSYKTSFLQPVSFNAADFNEVCLERMGVSLNHIRIQLPAASEGTLYYNYKATNSRNTAVTSTTSYYRTGSNPISNISFVPAIGYSGTTAITYTGYTTTSNTGNSYTGTILITVDGSSISTVHYTGSSLPINLWASDFQTVCSNTTGGTLSYIQLTSLPVASQGQLRLNYTSPLSPGTAAATNTSYFVSGTPSISSLSFVPKAEYQGPVIMSYTAYDTLGRSYTSTITITLSNANCTTPFTDMTNNWAKTSVEFLRQYGVVGGYGNNIYGPNDSVTRGQFTLMVCRAFGFSTANSNSSFPDVVVGSTYAGAIATARSLGIVQGTSDGLFHPSSAITRQEAMTMICRAMKAAGQSVPVVSNTILSSFSDSAQVSDFAKESVASLLQLGVVKGNSSYLNPKSNISRAEMAVILHRLLTL